jgi:NaMN:DMB phosphoribosyltransferase
MRKRRRGQGWLILAGGNQRATIRSIRTIDSTARRQCHATTRWEENQSVDSFIFNGLGAREGSLPVPFPPPASAEVRLLWR